MKDISREKAKIMLEEFNKIKQTSFWDDLMDAYEKEVEDAQREWRHIETNTENLPLFDYWIRLQVKANSFEKAQKIPLKREEELRKILEKK